ncbi:glutamine amidotransferase [Alicyclobacillus cycloheptanicus]|uniref:Lipid II isoglutaminyl synthase (glutamine-hydrolyzing) subunit GatD n=1 Tax=Alicyclobacillus cycloheptanicus TaxID=1457 RepID=A0ABT9XFA6_9BACL|nr:glutamine amidotransferase [Alicyclobacillus cycloheptanicus]MDQ0188981.1 CobQ-like glutamine amidotransferase family enzyme [Alicyclobacillus cycloheptanicus]WDM01675.1 glutamine amidotransferase [Alicyclobacillus cycloheptanicus]
MSQRLCIAHLYPDLLNLYADKGNILTLVRRLEWRGIEVEVTEVPSGSEPRLQDYHLVLLGGGSDREQALVGQTLRTKRSEWQAAVEDGLPLLAVCGGYQLLGHFYQLPDGTKVPGLELLDLETVAGSPRLIGNIAIDSPECGTIVGFENHGGRTTHRHAPLGFVRQGHGNNGQDKQEGVRYKNIVGTYIHGPLLPKNPRLADFMLGLSLAYAGINAALEPLDDRMEEAAHEAFLTRRIGG